MSRIYKSFADLRVKYTPNYKALTVRPAKRPYLNASDVVYDYTVGHEFVVTDNHSPFNGCLVTVLDTSTLKQHGYTHAMIQYNRDLESRVEVPL